MKKFNKLRTKSLIYYRLFETHPHLMKKFRAFACMHLDGLIYDKSLAAHALTVMKALDSFVLTLDDPPLLVELVDAAAYSHKHKKVTVEDFSVGILPHINKQDDKALIISFLFAVKLSFSIWHFVT